MSRQRSASVRGAPLSLLLIGMMVLVAAVVTQRGGGLSRVASLPTAAPPSAADAAGAGGLRALPDGLEDRGWVAEVGVQRWLAGSLGGRILVLPPDEIGLVANATQVVSVRYGSAGATSTLRVRDLGTGRLRVSVDRPGTISSAVIAGSTVYVTGDAGTGGGADAGVQAIALGDGSVRDLIPAGPPPPDATGPVTRTQLRLDPTGRMLGSPLCSGDTCSVDVVDLASGARATPVRNGHGFLAALSARRLYLVDDTSTSLMAVDATTGDVAWSLDDVQLNGVVPSSDGSRVLLGFLPAGRSGAFVWTLASADAATGAREVLATRSADGDVPQFYPGLSGDRFAVLGSGGTLGELLGGLRHRAALTLIDARSGAAQADALTIDAP
jgi:hypothetical protein